MCRIEATYTEEFIEFKGRGRGRPVLRLLRRRRLESFQRKLESRRDGKNDTIWFHKRREYNEIEDLIPLSSLSFGVASIGAVLLLLASTWKHLEVKIKLILRKMSFPFSLFLLAFHYNTRPFFPVRLPFCPLNIRIMGKFRKYICVCEKNKNNNYSQLNQHRLCCNY